MSSPLSGEVATSTVNSPVSSRSFLSTGVVSSPVVVVLSVDNEGLQRLGADIKSCRQQKKNQRKCEEVFGDLCIGGRLRAMSMAVLGDDGEQVGEGCSLDMHGLAR